MKRLDGIKACVFDAYGTLFDFASAAARCQDVPDQKLGALTSLWREKQLQYTWLRSLEDSYADFWQLTGDALDYALDSLDIASPELHAKLMDLYLTPAPFPEVPSMLAQLRQAGFRTAILSNGSPTMLDSAVRAAGLSELFDVVLSADAVKVFKPHPRVYAYGLEQLGLRADQVSFQSSNAWDAYGASHFGLRVVWCNRYDHRAERLPGAPDYEIRDLSELPGAAGASEVDTAEKRAAQGAKRFGVGLGLEADEQLAAAEFEHRPLDERGLRQHQINRLAFVKPLLVSVGKLAERRASRARADLQARPAPTGGRDGMDREVPPALGRTLRRVGQGCRGTETEGKDRWTQKERVIPPPGRTARRWNGSPSVS